MKIALIGYGKMGKEIEKIALSRGHETPLIIDINNISDLNIQNLVNIDVAIDFSTPESAFGNVLKCFEAGTPVVSGTTGWNDKLEEAKKICREKNQTLFWSSNYSLGMNIFFKINEQLARMMSGLSDYSVSISETHHIHKLDSPSGTAISLANGIIKHNTRYSGWELLPSIKENTIPIEAIRKGEIPGTHTIKYDSEVDFIEITHSAKSRKGLALGSVLAAEFIKDKKGFFSMDDLLEIFLK